MMPKKQNDSYQQVAAAEKKKREEKQTFVYKHRVHQIRRGNHSLTLGFPRGGGGCCDQTL